MSKKEIAELKDQTLELIALLDQATSNPIRHKQPIQHYASDLSTQEQLDAVYNSISWKITAPFRWLSKIMFVPLHILRALASGKNKTENLKEIYNKLPNSIKHNKTILRIKDKYLAKIN